MINKLKYETKNRTVWKTLMGNSKGSLKPHVYRVGNGLCLICVAKLYTYLVLFLCDRGPSIMLDSSQTLGFCWQER